MQPLQERITKIVGDEKKLNHNRRSALDAKKTQRNGEKRSEAADLATLDRQKEKQIRINRGKEQKFLEDVKREGDELVNVSREIRTDYITEVQHRETFEQKLQTKLTALEAKLRSIKAARP